MITSFANVHAVAPVSHAKSLSNAYDSLNFALTVEWDQKDEAFHFSQVKKFEKTILNLQKNGLTSKELLSFAKGKIKNQTAKKELDTLFNVVEINRLTNEEARNFILETVKRNQSTGSNWLGKKKKSAFLGLLIVLALVVAISVNADDDSENEDPEKCYKEYICEEFCLDFKTECCYDECSWQTICY